NFLKSAAMVTAAAAAGGAALESASAAAAATNAGKPARKPNFIFFLVDDMGWMDSSTYGSTFYETPNMDRMARRAMRFTNAYATPLCSPTRCTIMTGLYCERLGLTLPAGHMPQAVGARMGKRAAPYMKMITPSSATYMPLEQYTVAEALRDGGYRTAHFGKWHLGGNEQYWARRQGFDETVGGTGAPGPVGYFSPYFLDNVEDGPDGEHITDRLTREALRFIEANRNRPFYLNLWHYSVHGPWQAKKELIEKYEKKVDLNNPQHNPVYAAMLESMDQSLGRILDKLDALGLARNTVLIFMSDNGGLLASESGNLHLPSRTPITSNKPLRGGKGTLYEGGVREPLMILWPGVTKPGSVCDEAVHAIDFYPTMLAVAGLPQPAGKVLDGESLVPLLQGAGKLKREAIFCHFPHYNNPDDFVQGEYRSLPSTSVRKGDWKLIRLYGEGEGRTTKFELFNLKDDIGETINLAEKHPDRVREMDALIEAHIKSTGAIVPEPNPAYLPPTAEWKTGPALAVERAIGMLRIQCTGINGYVDTPTFSMPGPLIIRLHARRPVDNESRWQTLPGRPRFRWRPRDAAEFGNDQLVFDVPHDGLWHEIEVPVPTEEIVAQLRLFPGYAPDSIDLDWIRVEQAGLASRDGAGVVWNFADAG
ncbi:MAG: sulfatase, partial [bacterium]|nr:sulfatase [bacterium]